MLYVLLALFSGVLAAGHNAIEGIVAVLDAVVVVEVGEGGVLEVLGRVVAAPLQVELQIQRKHRHSSNIDRTYIGSSSSSLRSLGELCHTADIIDEALSGFALEH